MCQNRGDTAIIMPASTGRKTPSVSQIGAGGIYETAIGIVLLAFSIGPASAQLYGSQPTLGGGYGTGSNPSSHYVSPHTTSSGNYVSGHYQTNPNSTQMDNYSTRGNLNPHTGEYGTRTPRY
jgi:hypothetical protein